MNALESPTPQLWFHRLATHYVEAQILYHLNAVGVFGHLGRNGAHSAAAIAAELDLDPELLETLLDYVLQIDDLIVRDVAGRYSLSEFGAAVLDRFSSDDAIENRYNLFDVRVGCYGPVWNALDRMLRRQSSYGHDVRRNGDVAAGAVQKLSTRLCAPLFQTLDQTGAHVVVELGVGTNILKSLAAERAGYDLYGVDRDPRVLESARQLADAADGGTIRWLPGDVTAPDGWADHIETFGPGIFVSVHFHEFLAQGIPRMQRALETLGTRFPGWHVLAIEQPRLERVRREEVDESVWLYAQSNVLIHHLIGNGRILRDDEWRSLFEEAGCQLESVRPLNYLGYTAYLYRLAGSQHKH